MKPARVTFFAYRLFWGVVDLFFPPVCSGCGKLGVAWCDECHHKAPRLPDVVCDVCGRPHAGRQQPLCISCNTSRPAFSQMRSWAVFKPPLQNALHSMKYRRNVGLGLALAKAITPQLKALNWEIDTVVPIPLSKQRITERGYNQVATFAYPLAMMNGWEYDPHALHRVRHTRSQVGLTREQRRENVRQVFCVQAKIQGKRVLLLDDVITTGATVTEAARALQEGGAKDVFVYSVAQALEHHF